MALPNSLNLPSIRLSSPDFYFCDRVYGEVTATDCLAAARRMPIGAAPVLWTDSRKQPLSSQTNNYD